MAYARHLLWLERKDGLPQIIIRDRKTGEEHAIAFAEEAYSLGSAGRCGIRHRRDPLLLFVDDDALRSSTTTT